MTSDMERLQGEIQAQLVRPTLPFLVLSVVFSYQTSRDFLDRYLVHGMQNVCLLVVDMVMTGVC